MALKDKSASTLARLRNKAAEMGESYQQVLLLFCQEEFMRRVERSRYRDNLILKGGLFLYLVSELSSRTTMDVDFLLHRHHNDEDSIRSMVEHIIATETEHDYVTFEILKLKPIAVQRQYHGVQVAMMAHIKRLRIPIFVDFGVGDVIVPAPVRRTFPPMLKDSSSPCVLTYSVESTIAEKYDAIVQRMEMTSRMKDFFDISYLSRRFSFDGGVLLRAIQETLRYRNTPHDESSFASVEALAHSSSMLTKWNFFRREINRPDLEFAEVMQDITQFLQPVVAAMVQDVPFGASWSPGGEWQ